MRRRVALLLVLGSGLAVGATALAQEGDDEPVISMHRGCLAGTRLTIRIAPPSGSTLSPVHVRVGRREAVHLTGVTQRASVTVRVTDRTRVSVNGETTGGERFSMTRDYRRCAPQEPPRPAPQTVSGGGEG